MARGRNGVIGVAGALPWRLKDDLALFRRLTMGKPVIMGRRTWESLPRRPLKGRLNLVLTRDPAFEAQGAVICASLSEAVEIGREQASEDGVEEVCVIGGADVFAATLPLARRIYLTEVDASPEGDTFLPAIDEADWREVEREAHPATEANDHAFVLRKLERR